MAFCVWKDSFSIGIEAVDRQHQRFLEVLNECHEQVIRHGFGGVSPEMLGRLKEYADTHFQSLLVDLENGRLQGHGAAVEGMLAFLRDWFVNHTLEVDRKIAGIL